MSKLQEIDIGPELEDNVKELIEENESLRKGMHEILDSVHNQDGSILYILIILNTLLYGSCTINCLLITILYNVSIALLDN
jgi:hypothetical protein